MLGRLWRTWRGRPHLSDLNWVDAEADALFDLYWKRYALFECRWPGAARVVFHIVEYDDDTFLVEHINRNYREEVMVGSYWIKSWSGLDALSAQAVIFSLRNDSL